MASKDDLKAAMYDHVGEENGIGAAELAARLDVNERQVRRLVTEAIVDDGIAICGHPSTGYYVAANADELKRTVAFHRDRALHELKKASRLSGEPLEDLVGQLKLKT